jgi:3-isopropylmalate/(R)-2-methylmalate dehydratase small subunit
MALKAAGVGAVVAESFARIYYRNSFNLGLPALECPNVSEHVKTGDAVEIDTDSGTITVNGSRSLRFKPVPEFMQSILDAGGLREYIKAHRGDW